LHEPTSGPAVTPRSLRRSLLFVPGGEARKLDAARAAGADTLLLDLEDAVALPEKERARELVAGFLRGRAFGGSEPAVRVNAPGSPFFDDDLDASVSAGASAILVPKCEHPDVLAAVAERVAALEARGAAPGSPVRILALVETAAGVAAAAGLAAASHRIEALCFGHADFCRDMGIAAADPSQGVVLHARCAVAIGARAGGVAPIDTVHLDVRDEPGFRREAALGLGLGYDGKLCIHPSQVPIANEVYTPTREQVEAARRVVEAARRARAAGSGVFTVDGRMFDAPLVAAQERVLERARRAGLPGAGDRDDG
jgi:citrate lyase subunit beta/citryl-CoA lyase